MSNPEQDFIAEIKKQLDGSVDNLDAATRSRLNRLRSQALDQNDARPRPIRTWLLTGGAVLPALALGLLIYFGLPGQHQQEQQADRLAINQQVESTAPYEIAAVTPSTDQIDADELTILMSAEDLEMFSDLDFLTWLSNEEVGG